MSGPSGARPRLSDDERRRGRDHRSLRARYFQGFFFSLILIALAFAATLLTEWNFGAKLAVLAALAVTQIAVQFYFFLHIDLARQKREDLQLILFTFLLLIIMCGGTIWIMGNLATRM